jgi:hypothetical protein
MAVDSNNDAVSMLVAAGGKGVQLGDLRALCGEDNPEGCGRATLPNGDSMRVDRVMRDVSCRGFAMATATAMQMAAGGVSQAAEVNHGLVEEGPGGIAETVAVFRRGEVREYWGAAKWKEMVRCRPGALIGWLMFCMGGDVVREVRERGCESLLLLSASVGRQTTESLSVMLRRAGDRQFFGARAASSS